MRKKIAFIQPRSWPLANVKVAEALANQFTEYDFHIINIRSLIKSQFDILAVNALSVCWLYGKDVLSKRKKLREAFWHTPYIFKAVKRLLEKRLSDDEFLFTFQMQSLFDCSQPGVPHFVYTDHTHLANLNYPGYNHTSLYPRKWIELENQIYQNANLTFVRSSHIRQSLIEQYNYPKERIELVYAGNNVKIASYNSMNKKYDDQRILFVGLDWERKGGPELVEAFKRALATHPSATLTIVGASPHLQIPNCQVVGKVAPSSLIAYYESATIFCMPTHLEPFGVVFLEAMQAGLPIVTTKVGAVPDFIKDNWNGFLAEPGDIEGIANGLIKLLDNPVLCQQFGERGYTLWNERYTWSAVSQNMYTHIMNHLKTNSK